jgi:hypothetical protein
VSDLAGTHRSSGNDAHATADDPDAVATAEVLTAWGVGLGGANGLTVGELMDAASERRPC